MTALIRVDRDDRGRICVTLRGAHITPRLLSRDEGRVRIALVATVALLLAGDDVRIEIDVATAVRLDIVDTAATVAYDMRGGRARWHVKVRVAVGGALVWDALPVVVSDGAYVDREMDLEIAEGGVALLRETVVLGRAGQRGGDLVSTTRATRPDGRPLVFERLDLTSPHRHDAVVLGPFRVLDAITMLGARLPDDGPDALQLAEPGTLLRYLRHELHDSPIGSVGGYFEARLPADAAPRVVPERP